MSIAESLSRLRSELPTGTTLVAVSKTHPVGTLQEAYDAGQRVFGENRVQELLAKVGELPNDIAWHLIGHLQRNKVKAVLPHVSLIHSVDSLRLLRTISKEATAIERSVACLVQVHIAQEDTKHGFSLHEAEELFAEGEFREVPGVRIEGLMGMATFTDDKEQVAQEFETLRVLFDKIRANGWMPKEQLQTLSMGMSDDYTVALAHGSNMIRVGRHIFGARPSAAGTTKK